MTYPMQTVFHRFTHNLTQEYSLTPSFTYELKSQGDTHQYLGMDMDFGEKGKLKMSMVPFLKKTINEFPEAITGSAATPAAEHLFKVREEDERKVIEEDRARAFHHAVAQLLFVTMRCRR